MNDEQTKPSANILYIPQDSLLFGIETYEIKKFTTDILQQALKKPGHYTVKLTSTACKKQLHEYGFYYCDTLIEPYCKQNRFIPHTNPMTSVTTQSNLHSLLDLSQNIFVYGRFHRDFNLAIELADNRYAFWLQQLHQQACVYALYYQDDLAGFIAVNENKLVLHALSKKYQGKGLAKFFWSLVCTDLFSADYAELVSSISAANLAAVNLYATLGFRFRNAVDVYHRLVQ